MMRSSSLDKRYVMLSELIAGEVYEIRLTGYEGPDDSYPKVETVIKRIRMGPKVGESYKHFKGII